MSTSSIRFWVVGVLLLGSTTFIIARKNESEPLSPDEARDALLRRYRSDFGPTTYPVRELEREPLVVQMGADGRAVWAFGSWKVYADSRRYEFTPEGIPLFQTAGFFNCSWYGRWRAEPDEWVSVYFQPR